MIVSCVCAFRWMRRSGTTLSRRMLLALRLLVVGVVPLVACKFTGLVDKLDMEAGDTTGYVVG